MVEFVDSQTGEVTDPPEKPNGFAVQRAEELRHFAPTNPVEMERFIREAVGLLEKMPDVLLEINERRYAAEMAHSKRKNGQMAFYGRQGMQVTFARAQAELDAAPELEVWLNTKAEYHYADDTARALRSKVMAMLNINKSVTQQFTATR